MSIIRNFSRYTTKENVVTNNTMLLLGRIYKTDPTLFQKFLISALELDDLQIGPSFDQQVGTGGDGIPDAMIFQPNFRIVVEAKLNDEVFWAKERYTSHFKGEDTRILLTLSKHKLLPERAKQFEQALTDYDTKDGRAGQTIHSHLTYTGLIARLRFVIDDTRTRYKIELDELVDDFEGFLAELNLLDDEYLRMHVVPVGQTHEMNLKHKLYYNQTAINYSAHKFIGLYYWKEIRFIGEPKIVLIPKRRDNGTIHYIFLKGENLFTAERRATFEQFLNDLVASKGFGDDGGLRYHLVDEWYETHFRKESSGGIMGPRHCYLKNYIPDHSSSNDAATVASKLNGRIWEVG